MRAILTFFLATIMFGSAASAQGEAEDIEAIYSGAGGAFEMTIQYSKEGHLRGTTKGQDMWLLRVDGVNYFVFPEEEGARVLDLRIASDLIREVLPDNLPNLDGIKMEIREDGPTVVQGREGIGYRFDSQPQSGPFLAVMSNDPELKRLGEAVFAQLQSSIEMNPLAGSSANPILEIVAKGTPISFGGADLVSFEETEFESAIFEIPSEPMNKEESRALLIERKMIPAEKVQLPNFTEN